MTPTCKGLKEPDDIVKSNGVLFMSIGGLSLKKLKIKLAI